MQSVQPVHFSSCTSTTTMAKGVSAVASIFTMQSGCGITDKQASQPEHKSGLIEAISLDLGFFVKEGCKVSTDSLFQKSKILSIDLGAALNL